MDFLHTNNVSRKLMVWRKRSTSADLVRVKIEINARKFNLPCQMTHLLSGNMELHKCEFHFSSKLALIINYGTRESIPWQMYELFFVFFITLKYSARWHLSLKRIVFLQRTYFILHLVIYVTPVILLSFWIRIFIFIERPSSSFYLGAFLGSKPIDTTYIRSGLITARYVIRGRPIHRRSELRRVLKVLDIDCTDSSLRLIVRAFRSTNDHACRVQWKFARKFL